MKNQIKEKLEKLAMDLELEDQRVSAEVRENGEQLTKILERIFGAVHRLHRCAGSCVTQLRSLIQKMEDEKM